MIKLELYFGDHKIGIIFGHVCDDGLCTVQVYFLLSSSIMSPLEVVNHHHRVLQF